MTPPLASAADAEPRPLAASAVAADLARLARRRGRRTALVLAGLGCALLVAALFAIAHGAHQVPLARLPAILADLGAAPADRDALVVGVIRLPRLVATLFVGAALAVCGVAMQGLFRNPLADPGLLGVSSGAALAAAAAIVLGDRLFASTPFEILPFAAFAGAILATGLLTAAGRRAGRTDTTAVLLAGLAFAALANAGLGLLVFVADDRQLRDLSFWTLGSFGGVGWGRLGVALPFLLMPLLAMPLLARAFDALAFGEAEARHMGVRVERTKAIAIAVTAFGVGASVALVGVVGFVGIIVPHALRAVVGPGHRILLPASALAGALVTLLADLAARTLVAPAELPIGILTALVGAPVFLRLVLGRRSGAIS